MSVTRFFSNFLPITPKLVRRRYSNGLVLLVVCRKGYKNKGIWAARKAVRVSGWEATHCNNARALHTLKKYINKKTCVMMQNEKYI